MSNFIDLHVHSNASDGTCTPEEDVRMAVSKGLSAFALTDHDSTAGYDRAAAELQRIKKENKSIETELIPGIEISAGYREKDIHILGYYIDPHDEKLAEKMNEAVTARERRNVEMREKLRALGMETDEEDLTEGNPDTIVTRAHFARALLKKGYVKSIREAFELYLDNDAPCYVPRAFFEPEDVVGFILSAGGIPVLAHPLLYKCKHDELLLLIERLMKAGLRGIEVMHSTNNKGDTDELRAIAACYGLCMTGGSDFHGSNKPDIEMGTGRGDLRVPVAFLETLKKIKGETNNG